MIIPHQHLKEWVPEATHYGPCSADLRLGISFARISGSEVYIGSEEVEQAIDFNQSDKVQYHRWSTDKEVLIRPSEFMLATTMEEVFCPAYMAAYVEGRSSVGRLGLQVQNASFIDSGFMGEITLELQNQTHLPMLIYPGMRICQVVFMTLTEMSSAPYNGKYGNQSGATPSKFEGV